MFQTRPESAPSASDLKIKAYHAAQKELRTYFPYPYEMKFPAYKDKFVLGPMPGNEYSVYAYADIVDNVDRVQRVLFSFLMAYDHATRTFRCKTVHHISDEKSGRKLF